MKLFNEYTPDELLELTNEQVEDLAKLELLKDGEALPYDRPEKATLETINADSTPVYTVNVNKTFATREDAQALLASIKGAVSVRTKWTSAGYIEYTDTDSFEEDTRQPEIEVKKVYKAEDVSYIENVLSTNKTIQNKIDAWQNVMDKFYDARGKINAAIWEAQSAKNTKAERDTYMAECLRLADNDKMIAQRFFEKRFPNETVDND